MANPFRSAIIPVRAMHESLDIFTRNGDVHMSAIEAAGESEMAEWLLDQGHAEELAGDGWIRLTESGKRLAEAASTFLSAINV